jgi:hypothetical protein
MPNWVSNNVTVTAESKAELDAFLEKAKGKQSKITEEEHEFHFGAFAHPSDEDLPYYRGELEDAKPEGWDELSHAEQLAHSLKFSGRGWYDWNVTNWGTKWDACDTYVGRTDELNASISFQTAWSPPEPIFRAIAEQFPNLTFDISYEEEQGWGGEWLGSNGTLSFVREWDIPNSHSDYVERDNVDGCICSYEDDKDEWYDDCPNKRDIFVQVTKVYRLSSSTIEDARVEYFEMETGEKDLPTEEPDLSSSVFIDEDGNPID